MLLFIGLLFLLIGFGVLISGIIAVFKVRREFSNSAETTGKVVDFGTIAGQRGKLYCPQVEFQIPNGQIFRFQSNLGTQPPSYNVGQQIEVIYQITNPIKAEINSKMTLWFAPGCMLLMGLVFSFLGLVLFGFGVLIQIKS